MTARQPLLTQSAIGANCSLSRNRSKTSTGELAWLAMCFEASRKDHRQLQHRHWGRANVSAGNLVNATAIGFFAVVNTTRNFIGHDPRKIFPFETTSSSS